MLLQKEVFYEMVMEWLSLEAENFEIERFRNLKFSTLIAFAKNFLFLSFNFQSPGWVVLFVKRFQKNPVFPTSSYGKKR